MQAVRIMSREEFAENYRAQQKRRRQIVLKHDKLIFKILVILDITVWVAVLISQ